MATINSFNGLSKQEQNSFNNQNPDEGKNLVTSTLSDELINGSLNDAYLIDLSSTAKELMTKFYNISPVINHDYQNHMITTKVIEKIYLNNKENLLDNDNIIQDSSQVHEDGLTSILIDV
jgi:hypothetical protein